MEPFIAVVSAMYSTAARENQTRYWVEKTPGNEEYFDSILDRFPNAKFIHIIRDPLDNLVSLTGNNIYLPLLSANLIFELSSVTSKG